ncbi:FecR domain-containing protein [Caulobacter segnis]|uniref:FecR family protein n=1 Tax=Caulobacter segnis TaxID=88688 RepID=UPI00240EFFAF|nr:FecR domain-containing protein [Caulobacter segnis]MDG2520441.1 FecR domain-containing protein [Caulobacter segnis]
MAQRETSRSIDAAAADWAARLDRAPLDDEQKAALEAWLTGDARRPGALLRANAVAMGSRSAAAFGADYDPARFGGAPNAGLSRRRLLTGGLAAAGVAGASAVLMVGVQAPRAYATERGEMRLVPLGEGSTVLLNTDTRVKVRDDRGARKVALLQGEAYFTVADRSRPLTVDAGPASITSQGGAFRVRRLAGAPVEILVNEGEAATPARGSDLKLGPQTRLLLDRAEPRPVQVGPDEIIRDLAWREGKIAFQGETLETAARAFSRYSDPRIVITDEALAREPITGLFAANDPVGFSRAVASVFGAKVVERGNDVVISMSAT